MIPHPHMLSLWQASALAAFLVPLLDWDPQLRSTARIALEAPFLGCRVHGEHGLGL